MVLMARAAEPMLPGCWVPTRTMRIPPAGCVLFAMCAVFMGANGKLCDGLEPTVLSPCRPPTTPESACDATTSRQHHGQGGPRRWQHPPAAHAQARCDQRRREGPHGL